MQSKKNASSNPMDIVKAAVAIIIDEIDKAFNNTIKVKIDDPKVKGAIEDCQELLRDAKEELGETIAQIGGNMDTLSSRSNDMGNWLSAVMSYQETCIDGFPDGKLKSSLQKAMKNSKEMTSNALAIVSELSSFLSMLKISGLKQRRLLANEPNNISLDKDGFPSWMTHEDRRLLKQETSNLKPNVIVAKDGSGKFKTINEALAAMPKKNKERYVIYIKKGVYDETVIVTKDMVNVTMYGDGSMKTIVTGSKNFVDGVRTFQTATFAALGHGFMASSMGFRNTAGPEKHQAVALRVQSDRSVFHNCRMEGYQDTLYAQTHRQFYRSCVIAGTVDFIFGDAAAVIQNTMIVVRKPLDNQQNIVTAQGRIDKREKTGLVIHNCRIQADDKLVAVKSTIKSYLGRPWKEYSRTIIMESEIGDFIDTGGWLPWQGDFGLKTLCYGEYKNKGGGAKVTGRVKWPGYKVMNKAEAMKYTVGAFLQGETWVKGSGVPVRLGLFE
ncbi:Pectinesterase [Thalictrum thalictroides]|uniref:Pectinesterase n=1 Tax=Thalictrum thalictroides TaxID=46969 RepID=A0A7J6VSR7_THATH|nr:Pectinesterase [Thalictrum thalictroides]